MFPRTGPDGSYKSVDLFFTNVCTVTKELCVKTLCSSCRHILYNRINHLWAFFFWSHSSVLHLQREVSTFADFSRVHLHFNTFKSHTPTMKPSTTRDETPGRRSTFFFSKRKPILDMQGLCFLVKFSHRNHVVRLIK